MNRFIINAIKKGIITLPVILLLCCTPARKRTAQRAEGFRKVMLTWKAPFIGDNGLMGFVQDSFSITYHQNMTVYCYYSERRQLETIVNEKEGVLDSKVIRTDPVFQCFIVKEGSAQGYYYSAAEDEEPDKLAADSFLHRRFLVKEQMLLKESDTLLQQVLRDGKPEQEVYARRKKTELLDWDTTMFRYSRNLDWAPYRLSRKLDSLKGISLVGFTMISNPDPAAEDPLLRRGMEVSVNLKEVSFSDNDPETAFIKKLFPQYENEN